MTDELWRALNGDIPQLEEQRKIFQEMWTGNAEILVSDIAYNKEYYYVGITLNIHNISGDDLVFVEPMQGSVKSIFNIVPQCDSLIRCSNYLPSVVGTSVIRHNEVVIPQKSNIEHRVAIRFLLLSERFAALDRIELGREQFSFIEKDLSFSISIYECVTSSPIYLDAREFDKTV